MDCGQVVIHMIPNVTSSPPTRTCWRGRLSAWLKRSALGLALCSMGCLVSCAVPGSISKVGPAGVRVGMRVESNLPFVKVQIAGKTYDFLLDTGASDCVISPEMARALNLPVSTQKAMVRSAAGDHVPIPMTLLPQLLIGNAEFRNVPTFVYDFSKIRGNFTNMSGVVGIGIFRDASLTVDYGRNTIQIQPGPTLRATDHGVVAMRSVSGVPKVPLKGGPKELFIDVDTGSTGGLEINPSKFGLATEAPPRPGGLSTSIGSTYRTGMARVAESLWLGGVELSSPIVEVTQGDFRVGGEVLTNTILTLDQPSQLARITYAQSRFFGLMTKRQKLVSPSRIGTGIGFDDSWQVRDIVPGSPGAVAGVKVGDVCIGVQGQDPHGLKDGYLTLLQESTELNYRFKRGSKTVDITVPVALQVR
jgi:Aspartyl protease